MDIIEQCHANKMFMTLFRDLDINQTFYYEPDPSCLPQKKVSEGKASNGLIIERIKPTHIVFFK